MTTFIVQPGDCAPFHEGYVSLVKDEEIMDYLHQQGDAFAEFLATLPKDKEDFAYADGKWTVKQLVQHVIDTERIFAFRLLAVSRGEQQPIPGFEQEDYADAVDVSGRSFEDQRKEFLSARDATLTLVNSISPDEAARRGTVSGHPLAARAVPYIIAGHLEHHLRVLHTKYGL